MHRNIAAILVFIIGSIVSLSLFFYTRNQNQALIKKDLEVLTLQHVAAIQRGIDRAVEIVGSVARLFDASLKVERREFTAFTRQSPALDASVQALEWVPRVQESDRRLLVAEAVEAGFSSFDFRELDAQGRLVSASVRKEYFPVYFVEPYEGNEAALGFDLATEKTRLDALARARDTGAAASTGPITLVQEREGQKGILIFYPVYRGGPHHNSIQERQENLMGFALGVFRIKDLVLESLGNASELGMNLAVVDSGAAGGPETLFLHLSTGQKSDAAKAMEEGLRHAGPVLRFPLRISGRRWYIQASPGTAYLSGQKKAEEAWYILMGGFLLTLLGSLYLFDSSRKAARVAELASSLSQTNRGLEEEVKERKRFETAFGKSEKRFRTLVEASPDWVWELDASAVFTYTSPRLREVLGFEPEDVLGKRFLDFVRGEEAERVSKTFKSARASRSPIRFLETQNIRKDGQVVTLETNAVPIFDDDHNLTGYRGISRNVTARKQMENELLKAERIESLSLIAGGIVHDFNNFLTGIMGNISLAAYQTDPRTETGLLLKEAEKAALKASDLTQQLLTFTKGGDPVLKTGSIKDLVKETATFVLRGSDVGLDLHMPDLPCNVDMDAGQMNRVIHNLIVNSKQAMPRGGRVQIYCELIRVREENSLSLTPGPYMKIVFRDQGDGIPLQHMDKIFQPYFTTKSKGSGLGLASAYSIVKKHGGTITVESELNAGTTFTKDSI